MITLIGVKQAREGFTFIHHGPSPRCEGCEFYRVCIKSLEVGRVYEVVGLRQKVFPCELHEVGVRVVEVAESEIRTVLPSKLAIEGAVITFQPQDECGVQTCRNYETCVPPGLLKGDRCTVSELGETVVCPEAFSLVRVVLRRLPHS